jgi:pyridoxine kinase
MSSKTNNELGNHTGYKQFKGTRTSAEEIWNLYLGLQQCHLDNIDMLLSGYIPSAEAVQIVGNIAKDIKARNQSRPGSFFWGIYFTSLHHRVN